MCCFVDSRTILLNWCDDTSDPQYEISVEAYNFLSKVKNSKGESYNVVKIPQPPVLYITEEEHSGVDSSEYAMSRLPGDRLPTSYLNSYMCNGAILVPSFASQFDERPADYDLAALKVYKEVCKGREVIQIPSRELLLGGGGIHCILQQIPKPKQYQNQ
jgi:agmatine deiminase